MARFPSLLLLVISACTGRQHHHSLGALKPHSMSETMKEPTYLELKLQNSKLTRENEILKAQGSGMERMRSRAARPQLEFDPEAVGDVEECEEKLKRSYSYRNSVSELWAKFMVPLKRQMSSDSPDIHLMLSLWAKFTHRPEICCEFGTILAPNEDSEDSE